MMPGHSATTANGYALVREQVAPYGRAIGLAMAIMLLESLALLASPWFAGQFSQAILGGGASASHILLLWVAVLGLQALLRFSGSYLLIVQGARIVTDLSRRLYDHLQALPLPFHHQRKPGELLALLSNDAATLGHFVTGPMTAVLPLLLTFFGAAALMARIDLLLACVALLLVPLFYLVFRLLGRRIRPLAAETTRGQAESIALVEEALGLLPIIKSYAREEDLSAQFKAQTQTVLDLRARQFRIQSILGPLAQFTAAALLLALLWVSADRFAAGAISPGDMVSLILYAVLMTRPISSLASLYGQARQAQGAFDRVLEVMAQRPEPIGDDGVRLERVGGGIEYRDVGFRYPGRPPLLQGVTLTIAPGETVAITGRNGAGKSTLVALLMRLLDPNAGSIRLDGHDIREVNLASLRRQIGYVPQQVLIANGTIAQNIAFGCPDATQDMIIAAAIAAHADSFIAALPDGYRTRVGDKGVRLSGGQRQRLALARALLIDPPILVFDEATATFDPDGEAAFVAASRAVLAKRTVIIITHRPALLALADRCLVLEDGQLHTLSKPTTQTEATSQT